MVDGEAAEKQTKIDKSKIGFLPIFLITINSIMGTGIFFLPAIGARQAGLFSIGSWILMGLIAIYYGCIFGELVSFMPKEGGVYEYAKMAFGPFPSFVLGWLTLVAANITIAMLMIGALKYIAPLLPNIFLIIISIIFIALFNFMAFKGLKTGTIMLVSFAGITLTAVLGILIPGLLSFNPSNFTGWLDHAAFSSFTPSFGGAAAIFSVIFVTIFFIAETFFGWETATFLAEKVRNPRKIMPKVMVWATVVIAALSLLFVIASFSLIPWDQFAQSVTPLSDLATVIYGAAIGKGYAILVYMAIIGSVAGWIVASPNLIVALAKDKLFVPQLSKLHPKTKTPYKAIIFQALFTSFLVVVGAGNYETLLHLLVPLVLVLYASVVLSLLVIRKKFKEPRQYTAPFGTVGPVLLIVFTFALLIMWALHEPGALHTLGLLFSFLLFSMPIFLMLFFYYDPQASLRFKNKTAIFSLFSDRLFFPKRVQKFMLKNATITNNRVLELGASSGLLSKHISKRHPRSQTIVEQSKGLVDILRKKISGTHDIRFIVDSHLISRVHPDIHKVDEVVSFGLLSSMQAEQHYLDSLADVVAENGKIHFVDYIDLYKVIPNNHLLSDLNALKEAFEKAGFAVTIHKKKGLLWNYLIVDGIKSSDKDIVFV